MSLICFASPKGGVGKTTLAANLCAELASGGLRVVALDLDPQAAMGLHFGVPLGEVGGLVTALANLQGPTSDVWRSAWRETPAGIPLIAHGRADLADTVALFAALTHNPELLAGSLRDLLSDPGLIVVADTPPGPSAWLAALLPYVDLLVPVLLADASSIALIPAIESGDSYGGFEQAAGGVDRVSYVLNQWNGRTQLARVAAEAVVGHLGPRLIGVVYQDDAVGEAIASQKLLRDYAPTSRAARDIGSIARMIAQRVTPDRHLADSAEGQGRQP